VTESGSRSDKLTRSAGTYSDEIANSLVTSVSKSSEGILELQIPALVGDGVTVAVAVLVGVGAFVDVGMGVGLDGAVSKEAHDAAVVFVGLGNLLGLAAGDSS
jgi:hypothetical protein